MFEVFLIILLIPIGIFFLLGPLTFKPFSLLQNIFWITTTNTALQHAFFRDYIFDLLGSGYATMANWYADFLIIILFFRILLDRNYSKYFFHGKAFILSIFLIYFSTFINFKSLTFSILSLRSLYQYLLLAYLIYVYRFTMKEYEFFFKTYFILAIINCTASIMQFPFYGHTHDQTGGIFGFHGTGYSAIFNVCNSLLCLQLFLRTKKYFLIPLSIYLTIPIVTGFAYGGFLYLLMGFLLLLYFETKNQNLYLKFRKILIFVMALPVFFYLIILVLIDIQSFDEYLPYVRILTNFDAFEGYLINRSGTGNVGYTMGRIGSVFFALSQIQDNVINFLFGYGPGSISYQGYFSGVSNDLMSKYGLKSLNNMLLGYIYEMGFLGIFLMVYSFFKLYKNYKTSQIPKTSNFLKAVYHNYPITLIILYTSLIYVTTMKSYFLVIYFSIYFSFMKELSSKRKINL